MFQISTIFFTIRPSESPTPEESPSPPVNKFRSRASTEGSLSYRGRNHELPETAAMVFHSLANRLTRRMSMSMRGSANHDYIDGSV